MNTFLSQKALYHRACKKIADFLTPHHHDYKLWERKNIWLRKTGMNISQRGVAIGYGFQCLTGNEDNILIDDYAAIGINVRFWNFNKIRVGKFCMIAAEVTLTNGGHDKNSLEPFSGPLSIGHGCWLGNGARIIGSLTIGNNVIVGAGAVVVKNVPDNAIVAGVPARIINMRDLPDKVWHLGNDYFCPKSFEIIQT